MGIYKVRFDLNEDTAALIYLSTVYSMDLPTMLFLYEKYGRDLFYFFYLLSGRQLSFPKSSKLLRIMSSSKTIAASKLRKPLQDEAPPEFNTEQEKKVDKIITEMYDQIDQCMILTMEVPNEKSREDDIRSTRKTRICHKPVTGNGAFAPEDPSDFGEEGDDGPG